jgi:integrase
MPGISRHPKKGWRYQFTHEGNPYSKAWFSTKGEAIAAREEHRKVVKAAAQRLGGLTFKNLANEYLDHSQRRHAPKTYQYKVIVYRRFQEWAREELPVERITVTVLESFLRTRPGNISYNRYRKDLCALLTWAWKRKMISENPCHFMEKMPEDRFVKVIPSPEEIARLMLAAGEDRSFLLVLFHTLGRIDEVLRMRWEDVNFQERIVKLWTRKRRGGGWQVDLFPMNTVLHDTLWSLWECRSQEEWVFFNNERPELASCAAPSSCGRFVRWLGFPAMASMPSGTMLPHVCMIPTNGARRRSAAFSGTRVSRPLNDTSRPLTLI